LDEVLAADDLGTLWSAVDSVTESRITVRVLDGPVMDDPEVASAVRARIRAIPQIAHPNLAVVYLSEAVERGVSFVTMERLRGETLRQRLVRTGSLSLEEARAIGSAVTQALAAAHERGVVNGPIGTDQVFMTPRGPKVVNVGLGCFLAKGEGVPAEATPADDISGLTKFLAALPVEGANEHDSAGVPSWLGLSPAGREAFERTRDRDPAAHEGTLQPSTRPESDGAPFEATIGSVPFFERVRAAQAERAERIRAEEAAQVERVRAAQAERVRAAHAERVRAAQAEHDKTVREQAEQEREAQDAAERERLERARAEREAAERRRDGKKIAESESINHRGPSRGGVIAAAIVIALVVLAGAAWVLTNGHQPSAQPSPSATTSTPIAAATVPDVLGKLWSGGENQIRAAGLEIGRVVRVHGKPGRIVRTDPTPGEAVTAGSTVNIYVGGRT
jgi:PASTA domain-containing protein